MDWHTHHEHKAASALFFDPDDNPEDMLKAFNEFIQVFELRYNAQYPDPPKVSLDAAIERWKFTNTIQVNPDPKPMLAQYNQISAEWRSKDRVAKFLGTFTSSFLYTDWKAAEPDETIHEDITWNDLLKFSTSIADHRKQCPARDNKCRQCSKIGHFAKFCQSSKVVQQVEFDTEEPTDGSDTAEEDLYNINYISHQIYQ